MTSHCTGDEVQTPHCGGRVPTPGPCLLGTSPLPWAPTTLPASQLLAAPEPAKSAPSTGPSPGCSLCLPRFPLDLRSADSGLSLRLDEHCPPSTCLYLLPPYHHPHSAGPYMPPEIPLGYYCLSLPPETYAQDRRELVCPDEHCPPSTRGVPGKGGVLSVRIC